MRLLLPDDLLSYNLSHPILKHFYKLAKISDDGQDGVIINY